MGKNIVIFSDGTGQAGGLMPDETRSNVYKLYRATRCGPDTRIDPSRQLTFYDPGLGSKADGANIKFAFGRWLYNLAAQATGLGITRNVIDCYAAVISMWQPGDRIFVFGFSRGAYTVRCLGGVLAYCGVPTQMKDGLPLRRDPTSAHAIASEAVKNVYQYGASIKGDPFKKERQLRAAAFRTAYRAGDAANSNAVPYFIGVWDTVSTLGAGWIGLSVFGAIVFAVATIATRILLSLLDVASGLWSWAAAAGIVLAVALFMYVVVSVRYRTPFRLARYRMAFYDTRLNPKVGFARHALSIDENRKDFDRVLWDEDTSEPPQATPAGFERFIQMWFAGVHSDVGGGYAENESRLSDITLQWMLEQARSLPDPLLVDSRYLQLSPGAIGPQHDERKNAVDHMWKWVRDLGELLVGRDKLGWARWVRRIDADAPLHPRVIERFELPAVSIYGEMVPYRPEALRNHNSVKHYYSKAADTKQPCGTP